jgi:hypothetical protein
MRNCLLLLLGKQYGVLDSYYVNAKYSVRVQKKPTVEYRPLIIDLERMAWLADLAFAARGGVWHC